MKKAAFSGWLEALDLFLSHKAYIKESGEGYGIGF